ncbi:hypothetical protein V8F06_013107 [Rhypophila decipiens]
MNGLAAADTHTSGFWFSLRERPLEVRDHTISDSNHGHHLTDSYFFYDGYDWDLALQQSPVPQSCQADFRSSDQQWISQPTSPGSSLFNSTPGQDRDNSLGENWDLPTLGDIASAPLDIFNYNNFSQDNNIPSPFLVHDNALFLFEQQRALTISPSATSAAIWTANPTPSSSVSTPQHLAQIDNPCIQVATGTRDSSSIQSPGARTDPSPAEQDVSRSVAFPGSRLRIERAETHRCARCNKLFFTAEGLRHFTDVFPNAGLISIFSSTDGRHAGFGTHAQPENAPTTMPTSGASLVTSRPARTGALPLTLPSTNEMKVSGCVPAEKNLDVGTSSPSTIDATENPWSDHICVDVQAIAQHPFTTLLPSSPITSLEERRVAGPKTRLRWKQKWSAAKAATFAARRFLPYKPFGDVDRLVPPFHHSVFNKNLWLLANDLERPRLDCWLSQSDKDCILRMMTTSGFCTGADFESSLDMQKSPRLVGSIRVLLGSINTRHRCRSSSGLKTPLVAWRCRAVSTASKIRIKEDFIADFVAARRSSCLGSSVPRLVIVQICVK